MKTRIALLVAVVLSFAAAGRGDFVISSARMPNMPFAGEDAVAFLARNDGASGTGSKAVASDLTLKDLSGGYFLVKFVGAGATDKADLIGINLQADVNNHYVLDRSFVNLLSDDWMNDLGNYSILAVNPPNVHATYAQGVHQFEVAGENAAGGVDAVTSNGGLGALVAVGVVPSGDTVMISGTIRGDTGSDFAISATNPIPEPAALASLALGALAVARRRRA